MKNITKILLSLCIAFSTLSFAQQDALGIVEVKTDIYEITYSQTYQQPIMVKYEVICNSTAPSYSRDGISFKKPNGLKTSSSSDYADNIWDKGHMVPAAAFNCDTETLRETFSYLNCALQHQGLNRGPWKELEAFERNLAKVHSLVVVLITIHFDPESGLLPTGARVPTGFTKEIFTGSMHTLTFYFPNIDVAGVDWVEFKTN